MLRLTSDDKIKLTIFSYLILIGIICIITYRRLDTTALIDVISNQTTDNIITTEPPMKIKNKSITGNQLNDALDALENMTEYYCDLINSGDAGNWDPETDEPVIQARAVLKQYEEE